MGYVMIFFPFRHEYMLSVGICYPINFFVTRYQTYLLADTAHIAKTLCKPSSERLPEVCLFFLQTTPSSRSSRD